MLRTRIAWWVQNKAETATGIYWLIRGREDDFDDLTQASRAERFFYRGKGVLCLLAGWNDFPGDDVGYKRRVEATGVTFFDLQEYGTSDGPGGSCEEVHVGFGVFRNWYAFIERESWP